MQSTKIRKKHYSDLYLFYVINPFYNTYLTFVTQTVHPFVYLTYVSMDLSYVCGPHVRFVDFPYVQILYVHFSTVFNPIE